MPGRIGIPDPETLIDEFVFATAKENGLAVARIEAEAMLEVGATLTAAGATVLFDPTQGGTVDVDPDAFGSGADLYQIDFFG